MKRIALLAGAGSAALLLAAIGSQYLGGLAPCKLCIWQRWPHGAAALFAVLVQFYPYRPLALAGAASALITGGIGVYHAGVEQGLWEGPSTCTGTAPGGLSADDLLDQIMNAPIVRCDEIQWELLGISMAGWNALVSLALAGLWLLAWRSR